MLWWSGWRSGFIRVRNMKQVKRNRANSEFLIWSYLQMYLKKSFNRASLYLPKWRIFFRFFVFVFVFSRSDDFNIYVWKIPDESEGYSIIDCPESRGQVTRAKFVLHGHKSIVNQVSAVLNLSPSKVSFNSTSLN
jgi:hypothetical protein